MKKIVAAVIGVGRIGFSLGYDNKREQPASHFFALRNNKSVEIRYCCDVNKNRLDDIRSIDKKIVLCESHEELLKNKDIDMIVIAVNENSHKKIAIDTINYKPKLIILEKPVALNLNEAYEIFNLSKEKEVPILVNHERRYSKDYGIVRGFIQKKEFGELESVNCIFSSSAKIFSKKDLLTGYYSLLHDGTHLFDIVNFLIDNDKICEDFIITGKRYGNNEDLRYFSFSTLINNIPINYEFSGNRKYFGFDLDFRFTNGRILVGNGYLKIYRSKESKFYAGFHSLEINRFIRRPRKTKYFSNMVDNGVNFIRKGSEIISSIEKAILPMHLIESLVKKLSE